MQNKRMRRPARAAEGAEGILSDEEMELVAALSRHVWQHAQGHDVQLVVAVMGTLAANVENVMAKHGRRVTREMMVREMFGWADTCSPAGVQ